MSSARRPNVVIFAGAGASKAVDPQAFPTTVEFFDRLPAHIQNQRLFEFVVDYLRREDSEKIIDIEQVLWALDELLRFLKSSETGDGLIGYALSSNRLAKVVGSSYDFGKLSIIRSQLVPELSKLISNIHAVVYELYGETPAPARLALNWSPLLRGLKKSNCFFDIFTTNYDVVIESVLENIDQKLANSYLGVSGLHHRKLELAKWEAKSVSQTGLLTKLHGSVDWKIRDETIYVGDPVFTGDHSKQGIIYPGFKGREGAIFLKPFHDYFERALSNASLVVFIGFAFRDEYINDSVRNNLSPNAQVISINPDKAVKFPYARAKVRHMQKIFDHQATVEISNVVSAIKAKPVVRMV